MTTEQKIKELQEIAEHVETRAHYELLEEQIEELIMMLYYESIIRDREWKMKEEN